MNKDIGFSSIIGKRTSIMLVVMFISDNFVGALACADDISLHDISLHDISLRSMSRRLQRYVLC